MGGDEDAEPSNESEGNCSVVRLLANLVKLQWLTQIKILIFSPDRWGGDADGGDADGGGRRRVG